MIELAKYLSATTVDLDQLLLDPNNPRFSELGEELNSVPDSRFADDKVQSATRDKMRSSIFDVSELKDTIKTVGYLPMDRIVIRKWQGKFAANEKPKFLVIEGNRRITALKWLVELHENGKETFSDDQLKNFAKIECLLLDDKAAPDAASLILPGLRHVSGVKEWGPYQKAKAVHALPAGLILARTSNQHLQRLRHDPFSPPKIKRAPAGAPCSPPIPNMLLWGDAEVRN